MGQKEVTFFKKIKGKRNKGRGRVTDPTFDPTQRNAEKGKKIIPTPSTHRAEALRQWKRICSSYSTAAKDPVPAFKELIIKSLFTITMDTASLQRT